MFLILVKLKVLFLYGFLILVLTLEEHSARYRIQRHH